MSRQVRQYKHTEIRRDPIDHPVFHLGALTKFGVIELMWGPDWLMTTDRKWHRTQENSDEAKITD